VVEPLEHKLGRNVLDWAVTQTTHCPEQRVLNVEHGNNERSRALMPSTGGRRVTPSKPSSLLAWLRLLLLRILIALSLPARPKSA
jgi:hypothetical protein